MRVRSWFLVTSLTVVVGLGSVAALSGKLNEGRYKAVSLFSQVLSLVRSSYVEEVPVEKLEEGALTGLVTTADPQGTWVPAEHVTDFRAYQQRVLPPFGLVLGLQNTYPVVLEVLPGSAAAAAGLKPGELIERVGEQPVRARPLWRALTALERAERQGLPRAGDVIARDLSGKRAVSLRPGQGGDPSPQVQDYGGVVVVRVPVLTPLFVTRMAAMLPKAEVPVVVDLRATVLGDPEGAVQAAAQLLGGSLQLTLAAKGSSPLAVRASRNELARQVVACVDHTTARAGEWLAFLLMQRGVPLVGVETFGDTGLRNPVPVAGGELWIARYFLIGQEQKPVLGRGLKPTTVVRPQLEEDPILEKALELARAQQKAKAA
ncbi:MAG: hypothetical protein RMI39_10195 [Thermoanaerobaculum sp.]|nr:hypothetical protein [Thermoanaerobaculum sp.]